MNASPDLFARADRLMRKQMTKQMAGPSLARRCADRQGKAMFSTTQGKYMEIKIAVSGISPLILNRFTDAAAMAASNGSRSSAAAGSRGTPREIAEGKLYYGIDGGLVIPSPNLLRCLVDGGSFFKAGRKQITTKAESMLFSCLDIVAAEIPLLHDQPWTVDTRAVVIPATKGRILAHRPRFDDWSLQFTVELDTSIVQESLLREIVDAAGKRVGLGDFRPARKGPFGKFRVDSWKVVALELAA